MVRRVLGLDGEDRMPLDEDPLPEGQIALLRAWIDQGAVWPDDGSTADARSAGQRALGLPRAGSSRALPRVSRTDWARTPIDAFILARLEKEGLQPSPEAGKAALLRRVSLDLIGLPPTPAEIDAFVADQRPDAYEQVVDRLLASPHYGERWARPWLDLARYADSNGYEKDRVADDVEVPRLGDQGAQRRHAVRPLHHRADRRRHAAEGRPPISGSPPASIATRSSIRKAASTSRRRDGRRCSTA